MNEKDNGIMSGIILNIGVVSGVWGAVWYMWDHRAIPPIYLIGVGFVGLIVGSLI
jgi:hypothetical protein